MEYRSESQWVEIINQCKSSGLSDWKWCQMNNVSTSSFYYHLRKRRSECSGCLDSKGLISTSTIPSKNPMSETHEIVPLIIRDDLPDMAKSVSSEVAARVTAEGICIDIYNNSSQAIIAGIISSLNSL